MSCGIIASVMTAQLSPQTVGGRMVRSIAFGVALILGAGSIATAQTADEQAVCKDDAFRVCSHTIPDRDRTFQCMVANKDSLSPGCRTVMARLLPPDPPAAKGHDTAPPDRFFEIGDHRSGCGKTRDIALPESAAQPQPAWSLAQALIAATRSARDPRHRRMRPTWRAPSEARRHALTPGSAPINQPSDPRTGRSRQDEDRT